MSIALNLILASKAKSTHHKLALDALRHLRSPAADASREVFLHYWPNYLEGAKAPDDDFKDFKNHVCHVSNNFWGGAANAAANWYRHLLLELRAKNWSEAAYCAGVLSHYYTDPLMPFHTDQSESEGAVHRAAEWSIAKSYDALRDLLLERLGGWPVVELSDGPDWMREAIHAGATLAHPHYDFLIDHYNLDLGVRRPSEGFDLPAREVIAQLLGYAAVGFACILDKAFVEAAVAPPDLKFSSHALFATLGAPIGAIAKTFNDQKERAQILAMYDEYMASGKCLVTLPEGDRAIRTYHAKEVLRIPLSQLDAQAPRKPGQQFGQGEAPKFVTFAPPPQASTSKCADSTTENETPKSENFSPPKRSWFKLPPDKTAKRMAANASVAPEPTATQEAALEAPPEMPISNPAPKRSIKQIAAQVGNSLAPGAKFAATAVVSLVGRFRPSPQLNTARPSGDKKSRTSSVKAFVDRFRKKSKADTATTKTESDAVVFTSVTKRQPVSVLTPSSGGKFYLELMSAVEEGPSVGPKMAARLAQVGVKTVDDFLRADPIRLGAKLGFSETASAKIKDWQDQASLVCRIPNLRGHDAQILVNCGVREANSLATANHAALTRQAIAFAKSPEGQRLLRGASTPDAEEVNCWIEWAHSARGLKAA